MSEFAEFATPQTYESLNATLELKILEFSEFDRQVYRKVSKLIGVKRSQTN